MSVEWVSIDQLMETLTDIFGSADTAIAEIEAVIRDGRLRTARYPMNGPGNRFRKLEENAIEFWTGREMLCVRHHFAMTEPDGETYADSWSIVSHGNDAIKIWPSVAQANSFALIKLANERPPSATRMGSGGRPPEYDWEEILIEMARINHSEGLPETQATMTQRIQTWYATNHNGLEPGTTELKKRVSKFFKAIKSET